MLNFLGQLQGRVKPRAPGHVRVDSRVSSLHHRATSVLLLTCCVLVCVRQYFGQPIHCVLDVTGDLAPIQEQVLNTYCFVTTTYTVVHDLNPEHYPNVGAGPSWWRGHELPVKRHAYYQWVPLVLFLQSLLFAMPHAAWKYWEGGLVRASLADLTEQRVTLYLDRAKRRDLLRRLARYFSARLHSHRFWATGFLFCDTLNLVNVMANVYLTDCLLGGSFSSYGGEVLRFLQLNPEDGRYDRIDAIFPKVTKCTFHKFGPSGSIQNHEALCVMGLNLLGIVLLLCTKGGCYVAWVQRVLGVPAVLDQTYLYPLFRYCDLGDWLYLHLMANNMDSGMYTDFVKELLGVMGGDVSNMLRNK
uniref:Innexin n=1 Tax=Timema monikensis TaxID=170555 RepID=A0A7R9DZ20_9NEOP|nr:unnamed protein product [Timema monikensis]